MHKYTITTTARFEKLVLPHLTAAYNLARWLVRDEQTAEDMVQDAYLLAFRGFEGLRGDNTKAWVLAIVRNTCFSFLRSRRNTQADAPLEPFGNLEGRQPPSRDLDPEALQLRLENHALVRNAIERLPAEFREVLVLRELEGLSYKQIAEATRTPLGTVMSRLARARKRLKEILLADGDPAKGKGDGIAVR